jgi:hypothetical protein
MRGLARGAGEGRIRYSQEPTEIAAMQLLQHVVLVPNRPEGPNLMKHNGKDALSFLFPFE